MFSFFFIDKLCPQSVLALILMPQKISLVQISVASALFYFIFSLAFFLSFHICIPLQQKKECTEMCRVLCRMHWNVQSLVQNALECKNLFFLPIS